MFNICKEQEMVTDDFCQIPEGPGEQIPGLPGPLEIQERKIKLLESLEAYCTGVTRMAESLSEGDILVIKTSHINDIFISHPIDYLEYGGIKSGQFVYVPPDHQYSDPKYFGKLAVCLGINSISPVPGADAYSWFLIEDQSGPIYWDHWRCPDHSLIKGGLILC